MASAREPLVTLNISHSGMSAIGHLTKMPQLEELTIHKGQFSKEDLKTLPASIKVTEVD